LLDSATATTSTVTWSTATVSAVGYSGTNGASSRICYTKTTLSALNTTPLTITTSGSSSFPPNNSWGTGTVWGATAPVIVAGEQVYQTDGIYDPTTGNTVWNVPYLSTLKVGSLSAISANLGSITSGNITLDSTSSIKGGQTAYNTGTGFFLGYSSSAYQFSIGNPSGQYFAWNGTNIISNGLPKQAGTEFYTVAGTYTFTVPSGVFVVYVQQIIGGGGGGARGLASGGAGGGGGSGEVKQFIKCPASGTFSGFGGEVLTIVVGAGGGAGTSTAGGSGTSYTAAGRGFNGGQSSVKQGTTVYASANGGFGGYNPSLSPTSNYSYWQGQSANIFTSDAPTEDSLLAYNTGSQTFAIINGGGHIMGKGNIINNNIPLISTIAGTGGNGAGLNPPFSPTWTARAGQSGLVILQW
jgi:hypothetical protein